MGAPLRSSSFDGTLQFLAKRSFEKLGAGEGLGSCGHLAPLGRTPDLQVMRGTGLCLSYWLLYGSGFGRCVV